MSAESETEIRENHIKQQVLILSVVAMVEVELVSYLHVVEHFLLGTASLTPNAPRVGAAVHHDTLLCFQWGWACPRFIRILHSTGHSDWSVGVVTLAEPVGVLFQN